MQNRRKSKKDRRKFHVLATKIMLYSFKQALEEMFLQK